MKKFMMFFSMIIMAFMVSCGKNPEPAKPTLSVTPSKLEFASSGAQSQSFTVTAVNLKWEIEISASGREWITVTPADDVVSVTVTDNPTGEVRTGTIMIKPIDHEELGTIGVTVIQEAGEGPGEYSIAVNPASLTFASDAEQPQEVTVTTKGEGLTWTATPEEGASWLHAEKAGDRIIVSVDSYDNIENSRAANIVVMPSEKSAAPKSIRVIQEAAEPVPSMTVTPMDDMHFSWKEEGTVQILTVQLVAVPDYAVKAVDEEGNAITWLKLTKKNTESSKSIHVSAETNPTLESRSGYIIISPFAEGLEDVRILAIQEPGKDFISNLTDNVVLEDMNPAGGFWYSIKPNQPWDFVTPQTYWIIELWSSGLTRTFQRGYYEYEGTGERVRLQLFSTAVRYNDEREFYIPEGEYVTYSYDYPITNPTPNTLVAGQDSNDLRIPVGSWYSRVEEGVFTDAAPIKEGKFTVSRNEDVYTFTFELKDDADYTITGTCVSAVTDPTVSYFPETKPEPENPTNPDPDDPGFGQ